MSTLAVALPAPSSRWIVSRRFDLGFFFGGAVLSVAAALSHLDFSSPDVMRNGFLTREVIERLTPALPALRDLPDPERVTPAAVFGLVTVAVLTAMVERKATSPDR